MRQVFTSARLENVEQVARLLEDAGIEVRITNGRSYKGSIRGNFTYRDKGGPKPAVWIIRSEDQPRARAMLREAGLIDSSRNAPDSYVAMSFRGTAPDPGGRSNAQRRASRIKLGLLVVIAAIIALTYMTLPPPATPPPVTAQSSAPAATVTPMPADLPLRGNTATPDSLAIALLRGELPRRAGDVACIAIDGADPSPALLAALPPTPGRVLPASQCPATAEGGPAAQLVAVGKYEANASGTGTIFLQRRRVGAKGVPQWYDVRREGDGWRIVQPL
ncbi:hypothetical protein [Luteimonas mephitis]|uniref:hypothetical protein n=1 Tax=Luteimonas mephitis TaxID=83615 RepID=UPI0004182FE0|nr:hypothetical protein [Luteimonas mephitis]